MPLKALESENIESSDMYNFKDNFKSLFVYLAIEPIQPVINRVDVLENIWNLTHLDEYKHKQFVKILRLFSEVFFIKGDLLKGTNLISHKIMTIDDKPVFVRQYRTPERSRETLKEKIDEMLASDIIEECESSSYNAPIFLIPKKAINEIVDYRPVINFKKLNEHVIPDRFPIPIIEEILYNLSSAVIYSTLDLKSGYFQIPVDRDSMHKTAFAVNYAKYAFKKLPMGLVDSQATFQRLLNKVLYEFIGKFLYIYVDDIILFSQSFELHLEHLSLVFERLNMQTWNLNHLNAKSLN